MAQAKSITSYKLDELEGSARERALYWLREDPGGWDQENQETLNAFENIFPVEVKEWEYGYRNYINWRFTEDQDIEDLSGIRLLKYLWNNYKTDLYYGKCYWVKGRMRQSKIILNNCCPLTGYCADDDILKPIFDFMAKPEEHITFYDLMSDCLQSWIYACRNEYEYSMSEENLLEISEINGYEYNSYGEPIHHLV